MHLAYEMARCGSKNAAGLRWQLTDVVKPQFGFDYDAN